MEGGWLTGGLSSLPIAAIGFGTFAAMLLGAFVGQLIRRRGTERSRRRDDVLAAGDEGLLASGTLGLLALLLAFTFSLSLNRYEARRELVTKEANAIGTAYLRSQLLDEPHRARLSKILFAYAKNRIELAKGDATQAHLRKSDDLLTQMWAAVAAARESALTHGITTPLLLAFNEVIDLDTERKVSRQIRLPGDVEILLFISLVMTASVLGFAIDSRRTGGAALVLFTLLALAMTVITDLNRPTSGRMREPQLGMLMLVRSLQAQPPEVFDRFKTGAVAPPPRAAAGGR